MREEVPSRTAAWVAAMRGLAEFLPRDLRLIDDPYGLRFAGPLGSLRETRKATARARLTSRLWLRGKLRATVLHLQLRSRRIDDDVEAFVKAGGRQLVLLGAGFDCRAWRLPCLEGATVYEVDHPATQGKKRRIMGREPARANVVFVPWDFEDEPLYRLPARLALGGHDAASLTMSISEGVLPYLTGDAVEGTFATVASYSCAGSRITFTYLDRALLSDTSKEPSRERLAVRLLGEPFRHGFDPSSLPAWLREHGFEPGLDESTVDIARRLLPEHHGAIAWMSTELRARRHFASATRVGR